MPRKQSRGGFDYATPRMAYGPPAYGIAYQQPPYYGYPTATLQNGVYAGAYLNGYGSGHSHAYGADGYHHYMRAHDPSYESFYNDGPSVDERWRSTYPYVPTSYSQQSAQRIGESSRSGSGGGGGGNRDSEAAADSSNESGEPERDTWGSQWEFIFSCIGLSVGIGNVWRFPYLAYENGGGAFLIPYVILLVLVGKPMYFMEVSLGQFAGLGPLAVWKLSPIGRGVGFAMCTLSTIVAIYYNVVMAYCLHYMFSSFAAVLPWEECNPEWALADSCVVRKEGVKVTCPLAEESNGSACETAAEQYWERHVLGIDRAPNVTNSDGVTYVLSEVGAIGDIKWDLALCLLASWIVVFACLAKGIKSSGKVVYFTATFPYLILIILLVRGLLLEGAYDGIKAFFVPEWKKLLDIQVWRKAAEQMFFSLSVSWGGLIMFGSYNKFRTKVHIYATIISSLDFVTSIIAGVVVFSILGEMKRVLGVDDISQVVQQKQGLAFVAYPEVISLLSVSQLWSVLFFFMLFTLGLDSQFALLETVLTGVYDFVPKLRRYKPLVCLIFCCFCYLLSLPCVSSSGQYVFDIMDTYGGGLGVLWVAIFETAIIMWIYGVGRFADDLTFMLNYKVNIFWKVCWSITPLILAAIFVIGCVKWEPPTYGGTSDADSVSYPEYVHGIGWFLTLLVAVQIPVIAVIMGVYYAVKGDCMAVFRPTTDWGPGDKAEHRAYTAYKYNKAMMCKQHPHASAAASAMGHYPGAAPGGVPAAYDNYGMSYPSGYYAGGPSSFHM